MIQSQQVQGPFAWEVVHVHFVLDGAGGPNSSVAPWGEARLHAAAREPDGEAAGVVIATGGRSFRRKAVRPKFTAPPDQRVFEQAARF